jgi:antitoxin (DNA-binding transcriptional repressor) of toxin-antitoxin stability system
VPIIGIRELARQVSRLIGDVESSREPALITRHGKPIAMIVPVDAEAVEDLVLASGPEFVAAMREADAELAAGKTRSLDDVLADADEEQQPAAKVSRRRAAAAG